ncbi:MAG: efflux RND transporter periplasmic adaptor subunit, partial [bacterium]|nr:efflux RND transporter periplasmic adaptor subunit [bacterium]
MSRHIGIAGVVGLVFTVVSCGSNDHAPVAEEAAPPVTVHTVTTERTLWSGYYEAIGTVRARATATMQSRVMGYGQEVHVNTGDRVKKGQLLIWLDARDLDSGLRQAEAALSEANSARAEVESAIAAAEAQLNLAETTLRRMKDLHDKKSISDQEYDEAHAKVKMAEANRASALSKQSQLASRIQQAEQAVQSARIMKEYAAIQAPFDGTLTRKMVEPGNLAAPGAPLLEIERAGSFRLEAQVEESRLSAVRVGETVTVELDALGESIEATVAEIVPAVDAASRAFVVKINLPSRAGIRSGLFGRARFETEGEQV